MLVPLSWLNDYVALPADPAELVERLTLAGLEATGVRVFGKPTPPNLKVKQADAGLVWDADKAVVALVLGIEKHPNADKLKLVRVNYGPAEKTIVTGAPNIAVGTHGMKVVLGNAGTVYYTAGKDGTRTTATLVPKDLRGIMNDAMVMSDYELGISEDHDGIILLDSDDPGPGTPIVDVLGDIVVELDVLPNMARCLAMLGIAREVAALTGGQVCEPDLTVPEVKEAVGGKVAITIVDPKLCSRYAAAVIRNVTPGPAPRWMRTRLRYAGMRPIGNVVDVTNYVMLEYGQPLHAFDHDVLVKRAGGKPPTITVRPATAGEKLKTLDGVERTLGPDNLVIADAAGPIALAGVMGGLDTEVTGATRTILLESASFDFVSVRKTARQFNLFSEASTRFSKGIHPEVVPLAAKRAAQFLARYAGGEVLSGLADEYPAPPPPQVVELNRSEIARLLGIDIPDAEVERVLTALQFTLEPTLWGWNVTVPATRLDVQAGAADLIEELARVSGYDKLPATRLAQELPAQRNDPSLTGEARVKDLLADVGLQEVITYALTGVDAEAKLRYPDRDKPVTLVNPISPDRSVMRRTLLPGVLAVAAENLKNTAGVALFELGSVYLPQVGKPLPAEPRRLAVVLSGRRTEEAWDDVLGDKPPQSDFYDLKGIVETLAADLHLPGVSYELATDVPYLHPAKAARLLVNGKPIGAFGVLHPRVGPAFELADRVVLAAEFDVEAMLAAVPDRFAYRPVSPFPPVLRDVAVVVPETVSADQVLAEVIAAGGDLLESARLFDVYQGDSIPAGTKSLAYALTYRVADRQLTDKEVDKAHLKIEGRLKHVLQGQIRGK